MLSEALPAPPHIRFLSRTCCTSRRTKRSVAKSASPGARNAETIVQGHVEGKAAFPQRFIARMSQYPEVNYPCEVTA